MSATLALETADFVDAARRMDSDVAAPASIAFARLTTVLDNCGAMAGSDPGGQHWAHTYDQGAQAALSAHLNAVNASYRLAMLFGQSARNYENADAASAPSYAEHAANAAQTGLLPGPTEVYYNGSPPSASGGSADTPSGWWLIEHTVGYAWPNGHQDRLRTAAAAWQASAQALIAPAGFVVLPGVEFAASSLPEAPDMTRVCDGMNGHLRELSAVQSSLAASCTQLAEHIDQVHSDIESELGSLAVQSGVVEGLGALASCFTFGAAEIPAQAVEASRLAAVGARVAELIKTFVAAVRALAATLSSAVDRAVEVAGRLRRIAEMKLAVATVEVSRRYPAVGNAIEQLAAVRLGLGFRGGLLLRLENEKEFDPELLRGMTMARIRASIPKDWQRGPSSRGEGIKFVCPGTNGARQIRIMYGYAKGTRSVKTAEGPYAVVSQNSRTSGHIPLAGNADLP